MKIITQRISLPAPATPLPFRDATSYYYHPCPRTYLSLPSSSLCECLLSGSLFGFALCFDAFSVFSVSRCVFGAPPSYLLERAQIHFFVPNYHPSCPDDFSYVLLLSSICGLPPVPPLSRSWTPFNFHLQAPSLTLASGNRQHLSLLRYHGGPSNRQ